MRYDRSLTISKRLEKLLTLVKSGSYSSSDLAKKLGVSGPTVYRDINFLKSQGHPIKAVRLSAQWVYQLARNGKSSRVRQGGRHE